MKVLVAFLLVSLVFSSSILNEKKSKENDIKDIINKIKCLVDKSIPISKEVTKLLYAIQRNELLLAFQVVQTIIEDGKEAYNDCFSTKMMTIDQIPKQQLTGEEKEEILF